MSPRGLIRRTTSGLDLRRKTAWSAGPGGTGLTSLSGSNTFFLGATLTPSINGLTIVRTRGQFEIILLAATSPGDGFRGAFGIGIATAAAVSAGVTAVPFPITEVGSNNWLYHRFFGIHASAAGGVLGGATEVLRIEIDSKAMRRFRGEDAVYCAIEVVEIGTATASVFFDSRMLLKLP